MTLSTITSAVGVAVNTGTVAIVAVIVGPAFTSVVGMTTSETSGETDDKTQANTTAQCSANSSLPHQ